MLTVLLLILSPFAVSTFICDQTITDGCLSYDGKYNVGETIKDACFDLTCFSQTNSFHMTGQRTDVCKWCEVNSHHFTTFDGSQFFMNGTCNYTMVQPLNCAEGPATYHPSYAVYTQFGSCDSNDAPANASCPNITTIKFNEFTAVTIHHSNFSALNINGETILVNNRQPEILCRNDGSTYPFFAWLESSSGKWIYLQGQPFDIIISPLNLFIFERGEQKNVTGGICGFYSGDKNDDFLKRDCKDAGLGNLAALLQSWTTRDQIKDGCFFQEVPSNNGPCEEENYLNMCETAVVEGFKKEGISLFFLLYNIINALIGNCVKNCCEDSKSCTSTVAVDINAVIRF